MEAVLLLVPILAPVFITAAVGFAWTRWGGGFDSEFVARLVTNIFAPCLIFSTLAGTKADPEHIFEASGAILACELVAGIAGFALLRALKAPIRAFLPATMFPNLGNMGGPICYFAFGDEGLAYAVAIMATTSILMWTLGMWISSGKMSLRRAATTPPIIAAVLGAVFMFTGWHVPEWAGNTLTLLGAPTFPLMLLALGSSLAVMKVANLPFSIGLGAFRIAAGIVIGVVIAELLGLKGALRGVIILQSSMPAAVFNFLFAQINNRRPDEVAGVVVASTLIGAAALPLIVTFVLSMQ